MNGKVAKRLRKIADRMAIDKRGLLHHHGTVFHPIYSARRIYQALKRKHRNG